MIIALICPDSFTDYEAVEKELLKNKGITKIICATTKACTLAKTFASKYNIEQYRETRGKKIFNLHKIVQSANKVLLFEYTDYDGVTYSRTQKALAHAIKLKKDLQYVEYNRKKKMENATALFRERKEIREIDELVHSESRWSTIAHMALIWLSKIDGSRLKVFESIYTSNPKEWLVQKDYLTINNWTRKNSVVEGKIRDLFFKHQKSVSRREVDIMQIEDKKLILIEVKTVGTGVEKSIEADKKLEEEILDLGYTCEFYYLLSYGNEPSGKRHKDWELLDQHNCNVLLWEDLLLNIRKSPLMEYIALDIDINQWQELKYFLSEE